ncbi:MAG: Peptidoglycan-binding LysM [Verrucomicrobia bacterium]|nr:Peptidoglycan-binding LysM [Verrucomicrobiota bacterium]
MSSLSRIALVLGLALSIGHLAAAESAEITALRVKAEKGNALAQYNLGLLYYQGKEVPADLPEAFAWLTIASENGTTGKGLENVLATLTDEQLAEGRHRMAKYRAALADRAPAIKVVPKKTGGRNFSLTPTNPSNQPGANPSDEVPLTKPPEAFAAPEKARPERPAASDPSALKAENARLKAELDRAHLTSQAQAATIAKLQDELARKTRGAVPSPATVPIRTSPPDGH